MFQKTVIVCDPTGVPVNGFPCPQGTGPVTTQAILIETTDQSFVNALATNPDLAEAGALFAFVLTFNLSLYFAIRAPARLIQLLNAFRR